MRMPWMRRSRGSRVMHTLMNGRARKSLGNVMGHLATNPKLLGSLLVLVSQFMRTGQKRGQKQMHALDKLLRRAHLTRTRRTLSRMMS